MRLSFNEGKPLISGRSIVFINVIVSLHCDCGRVNRLVACAHVIARDVYATEVYSSLGKTGFQPPLPPHAHQNKFYLCIHPYSDNPLQFPDHSRL